jgi:dihydropyrimidinase
MKRLLHNGILVMEDGVHRGEILMDGERILAAGRSIDRKDAEGAELIDAGGAFVLPGIIDAHTHYHLVSRGTVTVDSFFEGSRLAAFGGVTTVVDFADHDTTRPVIESARERIDSMSSGMAVDFALHQGIYGVTDSIFEELENLKAAGVTAVKIFTTYREAGYLIDTDKLRTLFDCCRKLRLLVTVHAEDNAVIEELAEKQGDAPAGPDMHPVLRPAEAEARAAAYITALAGEAGMPIYIVHLSSRLGLESVRKARNTGIRVCAETTPHYLLLDKEYLKRPDANCYLMTPPLREKQDNQALWEAVSGGEIDVIATDHCAFTEKQKNLSHDCRTILPGIPGTEELLPLIYTYGVEKKRITLQRLTELLSRNPASCFGLYPKKGSLKPGTDADIVIFNPHEEWIISHDSQHSAAEYTPYEGTPVKGRVRMTILRGKTLVKDRFYHGEAGSGRFMQAGESSVYGES